MIRLQAIGNVGKDASVVSSNGGKAIVFNVAHNREWTDQDGVVHKQTTWLSCMYWRKEGRSLELVKYLTSGTQVFVEGFPDVRTYKSADGSTKAGLNLTVTQIKLLGTAGKAGNSQLPADNTEQQPNTSDFDEDGLPF